MRILICPALLPLSRSRRFPGGTRKSSKRPAISSWSSFRRAILSNELKRLTGLPSESVRVSSSAKETITGHIVTDVVNNVKRYYVKYRLYGLGEVPQRALNHGAALIDAKRDVAFTRFEDQFGCRNLAGQPLAVCMRDHEIFIALP